LIDLQLGDISHTIQLAIAPVFLLTGIGTELTVLTNRLARTIDRSRVLEDLVEAAGENGQAIKPIIFQELDELYERTYFVSWAITLGTTCGLFVCMVIACLFLGNAAGLQLDLLIAILFICGILCLVGSFVFFLREISVATKTLTRQRKLGLKRKKQRPADIN
jgi:hypothetical protein